MVKITDASHRTELSDVFCDKSQIIVATAYVARNPCYYLYNAFFLIFLIMSLALTIFAIPWTQINSRLGSAYTLLLSNVSFKWVINRSLPAVSYLTYLDKYSIIGVIFLAAIAIWFSILGGFSNQCKYFILLFKRKLK
jgi:hypothetical protein